VRAQPPVDGAISLKDAVRIGLDKNASIQAARAGKSAAQSGIDAAHAGLLPKIDYSESWTRSDNPVFVFSSLLTEHQFGTQNFQIGPLNRPDFLNNFQSLLSVDQSVYNGGRTSRGVQAAEINRDMAGEDQRMAEMGVIASVVRAYYDAVLGAEELNVAVQATRSAQADLERAQAVRAAGMSTDADVLSIRVHLAGVEEQRIRRAADLDVARAALNEALGLPLETEHLLTTPLARVSIDVGAIADYEKDAVADRPEGREARLASKLAENKAADSRSLYKPEVVVHGAFEADRQRFYDRGGTNWMISAGLRWNLFNGFADKARIEQSKSMLEQSHATEQRTGSALRLQVRRAFADLRAAEQRIEVARAAVAEAEESLRITQNRYEAGMTNITELLRTETALLEARTRSLAAIHDHRVAATMLQYAAGRLTADSEVLN
jgi:outer membrane protein